MVVIRSRETLHGEIDLTRTVQNQMLSYLSRRGKGVERLDGDEAAEEHDAIQGSACAPHRRSGFPLPADWSTQS